MDDTSIPFEDDENPFPRTKEDDEFDEQMIKKYNLVLKETEIKYQTSTYKSLDIIYYYFMLF